MVCFTIGVPSLLLLFLINFQYTNAVEDEIINYPFLSSPTACARACRPGAPPKICYYHFTLELYTTLGRACQLCTPNATNTLSPNCQCVLTDGVEKGFLAINRMMPGPTIQVCKGDKVIIDVENHIEDLAVTFHWHGVFQKGSQYYDGVPFVTQCPIHPENMFRYQWIADNSGTHFYHSHSGLQKIDGLCGSLIIRDPITEDPNANLYDYDLINHVILLNDWFHEYAAERFPGRLTNLLGQSAENILINGRGQYTDRKTGNRTRTPLEVFKVTPGRRYRFRMITAFATVCPAEFTIEGHDLTVIATDGVPVNPVIVNTIIAYSGERYDFVIVADKTPKDYWIQVKGGGECSANRVQQLGILRYHSPPPRPTSREPTYDLGLPRGVVLNPLDGNCSQFRSDAVCVNHLRNAKQVDPRLFQTPNIKLCLPFLFYNYSSEDLFTPNKYEGFFVALDGDHLSSLINNLSFVFPSAPLISQYDEINPNKFCNSENRPSSCSLDHCQCTHKIDIPLNSLVEMVIIDQVAQKDLSHPFHLHGYTFKVLGLGKLPAGFNRDQPCITKNLDLLNRQYVTPPDKDNIAIPNDGYAVVRFIADNPGFWFFHCHFLFHTVTGMNLVFQVGNRTDLPKVPPGFPRCGNYKPPILNRVDTNFYN